MYNKSVRISDFGDTSDIETMAKYKALSVRTATVMQYTTTLSDKTDKLLSCGSYLGYDNQGQRVVSANFCRERFCPMCQKRKSLKQYANSIQIAAELQKDYVFLHLVLTIRNCVATTLTDTVDTLYKGSRLLFNNKRVKQGWKGELRALEVTYNHNSGLYHPHLHCLVAVKPSYFTSRYYLSVDKVRQLWQDCLKVDYLPQVHISKCDDNGFAEISKYCLKPLDLQLSAAEHAEVLDNLNMALKGRRLLQSYGVIKDAAAQLRLTDELDTPSEVVEGIEVYTYNFSLARYEK